MVWQPIRCLITFLLLGIQYFGGLGLFLPQIFSLVRQLSLTHWPPSPSVFFAGPAAIVDSLLLLLLSFQPFGGLGLLPPQSLPLVRQPIRVAALLLLLLLLSIQPFGSNGLLLLQPFPLIRQPICFTSS